MRASSSSSTGEECRAPCSSATSRRRRNARCCAVFSAGAGNDYGHPRQDTLDLLATSGAQDFRTDQQGRILIGLTKGELQVWTESSVGAPG
jgi:beta-lactamase superfamily II metal-dependent hydrolase